MNYQLLYNTIIAKHGSDVKTFIGCVERHHIIPKSMGGCDSSDNLVYVSARVHFILHHILCKIHADNASLRFAFWAMCNQLRDYKVTSRSYDTAKKMFQIENSRRHSGKKLSSAHVSRISSMMKLQNIHKPGKDSHLFGKPRIDSVKTQISETKKLFPEKNGQFKGWYKTPQGTFASANQAAQATGFSVDVIRKYCKSPDTVVTERMLKLTHFLEKGTAGKQLRDLGWDFLPKSS